ncbi:hypothetical protein BJ741DRAFT_697346 [Chytriomyces cf. hyalinus JEL632]|nr:hypothetical protein BJ741DRAFT_697346 [Chytriomyces cf. hyalinus JEL632]
MSNNNVTVGQTLRGRKFEQDPNAKFFKIYGVVIGESRKFGYSVMVAEPGGIGALLEKAIQDPKIVAIVYNWETQTAFTKSGFRLSDPTDSALNSKFTTFFVKSGINSPAPVVTPPTPIPSPSPKPALSGFVRFDSGKNQFAINDAKFVPVGFNAYWLGLTEEYMHPKTRYVCCFSCDISDCPMRLSRREKFGSSNLNTQIGDRQDPIQCEILSFCVFRMEHVDSDARFRYLRTCCWP